MPVSWILTGKYLTLSSSSQIQFDSPNVNSSSANFSTASSPAPQQMLQLPEILYQLLKG